jgi:hypothetical protein
VKSAHHRFAIRRAGAVRRLCRRRLQVQTSAAHDHAVDLDIVSFSSHGHLPEQLMSMRSFLREAGTPASWTVVPDGTHTRRDAELLAHVHPSVRVVHHASFRRADLTGRLVEHAASHPKGAQLCTRLSLRPAARPVRYTDSDVLFFPGARHLGDVVHDARAPALYLPDCPGALNEAMLREGESLIHLAMHASGAAALDGELYVLKVNDARTVHDLHRSSEQRIRHYCPPVRYRFWLRAAPDVMAPRRSVRRRR